MIKAGYERVIVKQTVAPELSPGGIALPQSVATRKTGKGTVVSAHYDSWEGDDEDLYYEKGDTVYFPSYAGHEIDVNGDTLIVLKRDEILAKDGCE